MFLKGGLGNIAETNEDAIPTRPGELARLGAWTECKIIAFSSLPAYAGFVVSHGFKI